MTNFTPITNRFILLGLLLAAAGDSLSQGQYQYLLNIRSYQKGVITSRRGMTAQNASAVSSIHSIRRLNNDLPSAAQSFARFIGNGSALHSDNNAHNAFTSRATGFSGNPLTMVPFRPSESPEPFLYVGDSSKMVKANVDGSKVYNVGIAPPTQPPTASLSAPLASTLDEFRSTVGWATGGVASGFTHSGTPAGFVNNILYDSGTTGWCSINLDNFSFDITEQRFITLINLSAQTDRVPIQQVLKAIKNTTIASITYDSGSTGLCTIVPTAQARKRYIKDALIKLNSGGGTEENVRIQSISVGKDNQLSFRCSTVSNHAATESITGLASIRVNTTFTHTGGGAATGSGWNVDSFTITNSSAGGVGYITKTISLDLSQINGRAIQDTDIMSIVLNFLNPETTNEVQVQLDCSDGSFSLDYLYKSIRPSDFSAAASGDSPSIEQNQRALQRDIIDSSQIPFAEMLRKQRERLQLRIQRLVQEGLRPQKVANLRKRVDDITRQLDNLYADPKQAQTNAGLTQSTTISFPISELLRIGSDFSKGLKDIAAIRIWINSAPGTCQVLVSSWTIHGTYGPQVGEVGTPYIYRYRYRDKSTGVRSYPSPAMRSGVLAQNQRVQLVATASADAQVNAYDWFRYGGTLNQWTYIGTSTSTSFNDDFPDETILGYPLLDFFFQPFVIQDVPRSGTCNVTGTTVNQVSGDTFNTSWVEGTQIIVDGMPATLYSSPASATKLFVTESLGSKTAVSFIVPSPELAGQPLPALWGPYLQGEYGSVMFACGDANNAGTLYWTNPDDPDSMQDINFLEVTSPSEPLMNGGLLDGKAFTFSNLKLYWIYPRPFQNTLAFYTEESGCQLGIIGRWSFSTSDSQIFFVAMDGIYVTSGGEPKRLTDSIYQIFPHDGQVGATTNGIIAPDYSHPESFQLEYADGYLYFDYLGVDSNYHTLVKDLKTDDQLGWTQDEYNPQVRVHYAEEGRGVHNLLLGATDGRLYSNLGTGDGAAGSTVIACHVRTHADDAGDPRAKKLWGDMIVDYDPQGASITAQVGFDNYSTLPTAIILPTSSGRQQKIIDFNAGLGTYAKNITLDLSWSSAVAQPLLYLWQPSFIPKADDVEGRATDPDPLGSLQAKFVQGIRIRANTYNLAKQVQVLADNGVNGLFTNQQTLALTSNGESVQAFSFTTPFICHEVRLAGGDSVDWNLLDYEVIYEPVPELVTQWIAQETTFDLKGFSFLRYAYIAHISTANITLTWTIDGVDYTYTINHGSGAYKKTYIPLQAIKGKAFKPSLTSTQGFRLFRKDCEVAVGSWNRGQSGLIIALPFGDDSRLAGARI